MKLFYTRRYTVHSNGGNGVDFIFIGVQYVTLIRRSRVKSQDSFVSVKVSRRPTRLFSLTLESTNSETPTNDTGK